MSERSNGVAEKEVAVFGAGPAGIAVALELAKQGVSVILVESGTKEFSLEIQKLADLDKFDPNRHAPMDIATRRQIGGASVIWGGRCVPFDPIDFDHRDYIPFSSWPIKYNDVAKYHERASQYFRSGRALFSAHQIDSIEQKTIVPGFNEGDVLSSDLERWSLPTNFGREYARELKSNLRIEVLEGFTAIEILLEEEKVVGIRVKSISGIEKTVRAKNFILACGGLETTRLLLHPTPTNPAGLGNEGGWLGKCYMGHLSGQIADIQFHGDAKKTIFGFQRDKDGTYVRQRWTFSSECQKRNKLTNIAMWLVNPKIGDPGHKNGVLSFAYLILSSPLGKFFASEAIRQSAVADAKSKSTFAHLLNMISQIFRTLAFIITFGWKRFLVRRRVPGFFQYSASNNYPLHYHAEQVPNPQSIVTLTEAKDRLGLRKLSVNLEFLEQDIQAIVKAHEVLDMELRTQGIGELNYFEKNLASSIWSQANDGFHQAGTTRMSHLPCDGVVDENCRVHGISNLYIASSSVFVTSGQANSTFLIVALALRLADHLANQLRR